MLDNSFSLPIVYEDGDMLVVDKPAGLVVHPGEGKAGEPSLVDYIRDLTSDPDPVRPGIVHRLDKDTSGLIIVAKSVETKAYLQQLFKDHKVRKRYLALVRGQLKQPEAVIDLPIRRHPKRPLKWAVGLPGRPAVTKYRTLKTYPGYSLVEAWPLTGRTHQLRVHFSHLGHSLAGDALYGQPVPGLKRHFLHAASLEFTAPSGKVLKLNSPLPKDLEDFLASLNS